MASSGTLQTLKSAAAPEDVLRLLKDLKNSVIGNTWKKVEVADDEDLLTFLLSLLAYPRAGDRTDVEIVNETAVILGALASVGALTLRPLLATGVPARVLDLVRVLAQSDHPATHRVLPPLLRALRNVLGATADVVWGHMWGVGAEQRVVGTGLVGDDILLPARVRVKGRAAAEWRADATTALALVFEPDNRLALLSLVYSSTDIQILLPLYQLLARLVVLPSHREVLGEWTPAPRHEYQYEGSSGNGTSTHPFLLNHLLAEVAECPLPGRRGSPKLVEASLDFLSALVKGQPGLATLVREWTPGTTHVNVQIDDAVTPLPDFILLLVDLLQSGPPGVRISAAGCLTNIIKADKGNRPADRAQTTLTNLQLLDSIVKLLRAEAVEERVKLCFVLAALVSDDERLQQSAADQGCPSQLISMLVEVDTDEAQGELGHDLASRSREGALLALAALAFQHEPTRSLIADASPPVLPLVRTALSHPSYGVRAAACQLARALSRTVAILRTSLVDSGIGEEVVETLRREVALHRDDGLEWPLDVIHSRPELTAEEEMGDRAFTVEVAATATICNLVTDFSPLKTKLLSNGGMEIIAELTTSAYEPLALNALWALKNVMYHASDGLKTEVMHALGWDTLRRFLQPPTPTSLRVQALDIVQNLVDDTTSIELGRTVDILGEDFVLDLVQAAMVDADPEIREPGLFILSTLALGQERLRARLISRVAILESLSDALDSRVDSIRVPALRAFRHLIETNSRTHRPRQAVIDLLQPYQLKSRVQEIAKTCPSIDVRQGAVALLDLLERAR